MGISFVVFHTGPDTVETYKPFMEVGRDALARTNPGSDYIVLTDKETAPYLEKDFHVEVMAPSGQPLMRQFIEAQIAYESSVEGGLAVLAGTDCVAYRNLNDAVLHDMVITYRLSGRCRINNVAYIKDHDKGAWFLKRALRRLRAGSWQQFYGDQQAWEDALGPFKKWHLIDSEGKQESTRVVEIEGRKIWLYPCRSHNYFVKKNGLLSKTGGEAFLLHYKGAGRKTFMVQSVRWYALNEGEKPLKKSELRALKQQGMAPEPPKLPDFTRPADEDDD